MQPVLGRGDDAGLVLAVEGVAGGRPAPAAASVGPGGADAAGEPGRARPRLPRRRTRAAGDGSAPDEAGAAGRASRSQRDGAPVSLDSGSDSALTASESCLTWRG